MEQGFKGYPTHFKMPGLEHEAGLRYNFEYNRENNYRPIRPLTPARFREAINTIKISFGAGILHRRNDIERLQPGNKLRRSLRAQDLKKRGVESDTKFYHSHTQLLRVNAKREIDNKGRFVIINGQLYAVSQYSEDDPIPHAQEHGYFIKRRQKGYNYTLIPVN